MTRKEADHDAQATDRHCSVRTIKVNGEPTQAVIFPYRRGPAALLTCGSVIFFLVGLGLLFVATAAFWLLPRLSFKELMLAIPTTLMAVFLLLLGVVVAVYFGLASLSWGGALIGRTYVALTADALVLRDVLQRAVVPWDDLNVPGSKTVGIHTYIALRFRKRATVPLPLATRWNRRANRHLGFGNFDLWIDEYAISSAPLLVRAIRWHKKAPHTTEALTQGHQHWWASASPDSPDPGSPATHLR